MQKISQNFRKTYETWDILIIIIMSLRLLLPKLDISVRTTSHSPFQYPSDEEIFLYNDNRFKK